MSKEKITIKEKKNEQIVEAKKNIFHSDELKQSDLKINNVFFISPKYNPGCLKRMKSPTNKQRKYQIEKELYYIRDNKKVHLSKGETIYFTSN
jgi:hypothetical protein